MLLDMGVHAFAKLGDNLHFDVASVVTEREMQRLNFFGQRLPWGKVAAEVAVYQSGHLWHCEAREPVSPCHSACADPRRLHTHYACPLRTFLADSTLALCREVSSR